MYLTIKQQLKHLTKSQYESLRELSHVAKNLTNEAIYNVRQYYFTEGEYLNYPKNYAQLKNSENYKLLNSNMAQQILKEVDSSFKSFFALLKPAKKGKYSFKDCKLPGYLPKEGFATLVIGFVRLSDNQLIVPFSNQYRKDHEKIVINLPPTLYDKTIKEIRIIPKCHARFFEVQYTYEVTCPQIKENNQSVLALDMGVNNLITAVDTSGHSFIIDGRRLKSINQWFNKQSARLQSIKDKQGLPKQRTKKQSQLSTKHSNQVNDYMHKAAKIIMRYCQANQINTLVVGYNETLQRGSNIGRQNNQNFCFLPFGKLRSYLEYQCSLSGIQFIKQEESYTSKASFWDRDELPIYNDDNPQEYIFSGKRIHRGLYQTSQGIKLNADINGALNILKKSNVVSLETLYSSGEVDTPIRIRIA